ncbi:ABC transporter permease [Clostridium hydrogenum]|uniref:ABC transporter permease n=1 Tax=Clostridium hydrogenum TaxID=2855764 RepID=UPI001F466477|nr:ABC transporter permease [Clostridium hydrogenum]
MKLNDSVKMAFSDLSRRKLRTALTSFGIAIGAILVIAMSGLGQGIQTITNDEIKQMDTFRDITVKPQQDLGSGKTKDKKIDQDALNKFKDIKDVSGVTASINTTVTDTKLDGKAGKTVNIKGDNLNFNMFMEGEKNQLKTNKKKFKKYGDSYIVAGSEIKQGDNTSVLVGQGYLNKIGIKNYKSVIGKTIEIKVQLPKMQGLVQKQPLVINAKVVGVVNKGFNDGENMIITADEMAAKIQEYYMNSKDYINTKGYDSVTVEAKSMDSVSKVNKEIKKMGYVTVSQEGYADRMNAVLIIFKVLLMAAGVVVLLVASIGVINTMSMAVYEKTKSIGIMKAQGASRGNIRTMFVVQSGSLGFVGAASGAVIAIVGGAIANKIIVANNIGGIEKGMNLIDIRISTVVFTIVFTVAVAMIAGLVPAGKAAKLNPVDSLRCE